eukprot:14800806-Heterocapsa_arctica.AAC.1
MFMLSCKRLNEDDEDEDDEGLKLITVRARVDHCWITCVSVLYHCCNLLDHDLITCGTLLEHFWSTFGALCICVLSLPAAS